jgi:hypothetical protein
MGISGGPYIVRDSSLVLELDAADRNSYSGSGTTWTDLTRGDLFSLVSGTAYWNNGNGSMYIDGIDDGISGSNILNYSITNSISLETWVYVSSSIGVSDSGFIIGKGPSNGATSERPGNYELQISKSNALGFLHQTTTTGGDGSYAFYNSAQNVFSSNQWTHIVATCDGSTSTIYTNGIPRSTTRGFAGIDGGIVATNTQSLKIAKRTDGAVMAGSIAITRIYNRILSADEVLQNYNAHRSRFELSTVPATNPTTTTTTTTSTTTTTTTAVYTVTVYQGNSATRTVGGVSSIVYKLGAGGSKTTLASGITDGTCPGPTLRGTITNVPAGTVLYIGAQIGGTTDQTFDAQNSTSCPAGSTARCGYNTNPYTITVNSNISVALNLNVSAGAYTTC